MQRTQLQKPVKSHKYAHVKVIHAKAFNYLINEPQNCKAFESSFWNPMHFYLKKSIYKARGTWQKVQVSVAAGKEENDSVIFFSFSFFAFSHCLCLMINNRIF